MRAHFFKSVIDTQGNLINEVSVRVMQPGSETLVDVPLYVDGIGSAVRTNPFVIMNGFVDFYLDTPQRVRLGVQTGIEPERFYEDLDVTAIPDEVLVTSPDGTVYRLVVSNAGVLTTEAVV